MYIQVNKWLKNVLNVLYPPTCVLCEAAGSANYDLCDGCFKDLPFNIGACRVCAIPLPDDLLQNMLLCGQCQQQTRHFHRCDSLLQYQPPIDKLIQLLKFKHKLAMGRLLGNLMADALESQWSSMEKKPQCIIPVPLHAKRIRQRGYNQALELAKPIAKRLGLPINDRCCRRSKATAPQSDLSADDRQRNIADAFEIRAPLDLEHVVIVDDVMTTGHTLDSLASALRNAGIKRVDAWVCARAVLK